MLRMRTEIRDGIVRQGGPKCGAVMMGRRMRVRRVRMGEVRLGEIDVVRGAERGGDARVGDGVGGKHVGPGPGHRIVGHDKPARETVSRRRGRRVGVRRHGGCTARVVVTARRGRRHVETTEQRRQGVRRGRRAKGYGRREAKVGDRGLRQIRDGDGRR